MRPTARIAAALAAAVLALAGVGCSGTPRHGGAGPSTGPGGGVTGGANGDAGAGPATKLTVAFLMPCSSTCGNHFEQQDRPLFLQAVRELDPGVTVIAENADGHAAQQLSQARSALARGARVVVLDPVDKATGAAVAAEVKAVGVPLVSYDTLVTGAATDYYVAFDNERAGELQGEYLARRLPPGATVAIVNAEQGTEQGRAFKAGAHKILDPLFTSGKLRRGYEADARPATAATGRVLARQALSLTHGELDGVLAATDTLAQGVIDALATAHLSGKVTVTGDGASDAGLRRVLLRTQAMTVYNAIKQEVGAAARIAVAAGRGDTKAARADTRTTVDNGAGAVPTLLLTPIVVTSFNMGQTVLADGFTTRQRLCTTAVRDKCPA
jgi:D-xylose transport system substrate-binding protein